MRIMRGSQQSAVDYIDVLQARQEIIADASLAFAEYDAILLPTIPCIAPPIAEVVADDQRYTNANATLLRNANIFNFLDGCALSVPCHLPGEAPVGLMIAGLGGQDKKVLSIGAAIESVLAAAGRAVHSLGSTAAICVACLLMHCASLKARARRTAWRGHSHCWYTASWREVEIRDWTAHGQSKFAFSPRGR